MPTSLYNFQYVPLTGRLPGKSFVSQTEQAINGLAQYVYNNSTNYEAVKAIAQKAEEDSSSALEYSEEALDKAQTALETVGRAYIKTISAVDLDDYFDSELLLILSTESTNLPANITGYLTVMSSDTHDYCMQVYIGIDGSVYKRTATITNNTPTFGAWSETPITMSSLQTILADYAKANASNIGVNAQTDNSVAWGNAIGGGEIANGEQRLITGGTVYPLSQNVAQNASNIATNTADIVQNTGGISANSKRITNIEKLLQGNLYDYQTDSTSAYTKSVPSGAMPYAGLESLGGKTVVWNQLVDSGTTAVSTISGHKYYTLIDGTASIVTADGTAITIVDDTADMVCDLTLMFGRGNEPSTTADFTAIFGATHYSYNAGELLSAGVTEVVSKDGNNATLQTYSIPAEIQALEGYGWSAGSVYNYIDFERKVFVQNVARADLGALNYVYDVEGGRNYFYTDGLANVIKPTAGKDAIPNIISPLYVPVIWNSAWGATSANMSISQGKYSGEQVNIQIKNLAYTDATAFKSAMSGVYLYYALATPIETDISQYLTDDNIINVESGGTLTFPNSNGDDYRLPVPSSETYMIDLQEAINNG